MTERPGSARFVEAGRIIVDGRPVPFAAGDSVAIALLRTGSSPSGPGTLCLTGDCGNCLAQVDGIAYVRTCQQRALPGLSVERPEIDGLPPLPAVTGPDLTTSPGGPDIEVLRAHVDVAVIGRASRPRFPSLARSERKRRSSCSTGTSRAFSSTR